VKPTCPAIPHMLVVYNLEASLQPRSETNGHAREAAFTMRYYFKKPLHTSPPRINAKSRAGLCHSHCQ
jgi:hypothetical protein